MPRFGPNNNANPNGRPKLPEELKGLRTKTLSKAVQILHKKIHDKVYIASLKPADLIHLLEVAFDRCGLPKVTKNELTGSDGKPLAAFTLVMGDKVPK